jgi:hypothetical protein
MSEPSVLALHLPQLVLVNAEGGFVEETHDDSAAVDGTGQPKFAEISSVAMESS